MRNGGRLFLLLWMIWVLAPGGAGTRAADIAPEYVSKATYLTRLRDFVRWPGSDEITFGILGEDPFDGALDKVNVKRSTKIEDLKDCQVIYISKSEQGNLDRLFDSLGSANILTVGDSEGFAKQGGMIGFVMEGDQVRFEINTGSARRAGLKIDLRLLKLALRVFNS